MHIHWTGGVRNIQPAAVFQPQRGLLLSTAAVSGLKPWWTQWLAGTPRSKETVHIQSAGLEISNLLRYSNPKKDFFMLRQTNNTSAGPVARALTRGNRMWNSLFGQQVQFSTLRRTYGIKSFRLRIVRLCLHATKKPRSRCCRRHCFFKIGMRQRKSEAQQLNSASFSNGGS